ncbi:LCP family protein [Bacillus coahuilensis]|uniref:LCP family protein n=1 Tax=Bacillus coahuilensis TaxID=408580 RepID=UPI0007500F42|nr:LCP family protein [Bacillus coahuilensis]
MMLFYLTTLAIFLVGYIGYIVYSAYNSATQTYVALERGDKSELREDAVKLTKEPFSVLIMGVEDYSSGGENGRSDTIILATINPIKGDIQLLSVPRDTLVEIPEIGEDKINHSFSKGGKDLTLETVEQFLDIPIDYYVTIGFQGFKTLIDEVGGVTVEVPFSFSEKNDTTKELIYFTEGNMDLNGEEALAYVRMRKQDPRGDFGRNDRQKQVIENLFEELIKPSSVVKLDRIADKVSDEIQTNIKVSDGLSLISSLARLDAQNIEKLQLIGEDDYIGGTYYFVPDANELLGLKNDLKSHLELSSNAVLTDIKESAIEE